MMKEFMKKVLCLFLSAGLGLCMTSCGDGRTAAPKKIRALIVPKFESGEMTGDFPGEAQLFYERYCPGEKEIALAHLPPDGHFYFNEKTGAAILLTGSGKTAAVLALTALFSNTAYDLSDAYIISVGCSGGSTGTCTLGDVVVVTGACDNELGHTADVREFADTAADVTWFHDGSFDGMSSRLFDQALAARAYELTKNVPLRSTEYAMKLLAENFPGEAWAMRAPTVLKGSALTGDSYWKGLYGHKNAEAVTAAYNLPDPYAVTEMEDLAIANTVACYGLLDRLVTFRVVVDLDVFFKGDRPEAMWGGSYSYNEEVATINSEMLDIFEPAMHNLADTASVVIDAVLEGKIGG